MITKNIIAFCLYISLTIAYSCNELQTQFGSSLEYCEEESSNAIWLMFKEGSLSSVPSLVFKVNTLKALDLSNNKITTLPKDIGNLTNLQKLYIHNNQLSEIPKEIGNLKKLQYLYLNNNKLTSLPTEIGNLTSLQEL
ncbi:L domain-like protein [Piromyces finnis]|uniref:L domain-like protein n=1 Tax=Piromyces finnis TaxID=1754191 RepID=A0A1Y1VBS5_9FUNG|nr:L domain-like protein [Piromyces finnis]|eukprot:ORX52206.1 L domain-like protein [Piromyces finnis]